MGRLEEIFQRILSFTAIALLFLSNSAEPSSHRSGVMSAKLVISPEKDVTTLSPTYKPPSENKQDFYYEGYENISQEMEDQNETVAEEEEVYDNETQSDVEYEETIQGKLGPHNTPMGTPSHSKGIGFIDDPHEIYKCYSCQGKACALTQTSDSSTCNTTRRTCWMTFAMVDGMVTRGCSSLDHMIKCTDTYPSGFITNGRCSFCCTDNLCNWHVLMNSTCVNVYAQSSAPSMSPYCPSLPSSLLFILVIVYRICVHHNMK